MIRRALVLVVALLVAASGTALGGPGDPQKRITPADQARARSILLRKADLGLGVTGVRPATTGQTDFYCASLDGSDLVLTGEAQSPQYALGVVFVSSAAQVYRTLREANVAWRRGTSARGVRCAAAELRRLARQGGVRLVSLRKMAFPRVAPRTVAYRAVLDAPTQGGALRLTIDLLVLQQGRAHAALVQGTVVGVPQRDLELDLARIVARRMARVMRG